LATHSYHDGFRGQKQAAGLSTPELLTASPEQAELDCYGVVRLPFRFGYFQQLRQQQHPELMRQHTCQLRARSGIVQQNLWIRACIAPTADRRKQELQLW
jgi:hypothetical protein